METLEKKYVFITSNISNMGGAQNYVRSKIKYLMRDGWKIYIFFQGNNETKCAFEELDDYLDGNIARLHTLPDQIYGMIGFYTILFKMLKHIDYSDTEQCSYFIETHFEYAAIWGEILAQIVSAKHIFFNLQENVRVMGSHYSDYIDFFKFKFERRELAGIADSSMHRMFEGYMDVPVSEEYVLRAVAENNIKDIESPLVEQLPHRDWNIAYFGRCNKGYFPYILYEIRMFCRKYSTKKIHFIIISALGEAERNLVERLNDVDNLTVSRMGYFNPIPQKLFHKIDVMIAGSGCAGIAYRQGLPVIIPDARFYTGTGILGYTTDSPLYGEHEYTYVELLENVLITKEYLKHPFINIYKYRPTVEEAYDIFWEFVSKSASSYEYYKFHYEKIHFSQGVATISFFHDFLDELSRHRDERECFAKWINERYGTRIALFGYGKLGQRIVRDIPELSFQMILDNRSESISGDVTVVSPTEEAIQHIETIFISSFKLMDEMTKELEDKQFKGICVSFIQVSTEYLEERIFGNEKSW